MISERLGLRVVTTLAKPTRRHLRLKRRCEIDSLITSPAIKCGTLEETRPHRPSASSPGTGNSPSVMRRLPVALQSRRGKCRSRVAGWTCAAIKGSRRAEKVCGMRRWYSNALCGGKDFNVLSFCLADRSSLDLFELLQGAQIGGVWLPRVDLWPRRPGNLTNIDVAMSVDCETMRGQELAKFRSGGCVAKAAD